MEAKNGPVGWNGLTAPLIRHTPCLGPVIYPAFIQQPPMQSEIVGEVRGGDEKEGEGGEGEGSIKGSF